MKNTDRPTTSTTTEPEVESKRPFIDPQISDAVEVVKGNPAATSLFAVAGSGTLP